MNPTLIELSFRDAADLIAAGSYRAAYIHALNGMCELSKLQADADIKELAARTAKLMNHGKY